jgi:hypothetical protein
MFDLDRLIPALALVAWLLYLAAGYPRFGLSERDRRRVRIAALLAVGVGIAIGIVATVQWMMGKPY